MEARKLTYEEIENLFELCEFHKVYHYDVQLELVDHFASAIEQKWVIDPELSFEEVLQEEYGQFENQYFGQIRKAKEETLRKKYIGIQWQYIHEYFKLPKIILTTLISLSLYIFFCNYSKYFFVVLCLMLLHLFTLIIYSQIIYPRRDKINLVEGKDFLLVDILNHMKGRIYYLLQLPVNLFVIITCSNRVFELGLHFADIDSLGFRLFISFLITFSVIFSIASFSVLQRIKEDFTREFPQFVKS